MYIQTVQNTRDFGLVANVTGTESMNSHQEVSTTVNSEMEFVTVKVDTYIRAETFTPARSLRDIGKVKASTHMRKGAPMLVNGSAIGCTASAKQKIQTERSLSECGLTDMPTASANLRTATRCGRSATRLAPSSLRANLSSAHRPATLSPTGSTG